MQGHQQVTHAGVLHDLAVVDDGDVAAELLRLFQVVGGEDDADAFLVEFGEEAPHRTTQLDVDPGAVVAGLGHDDVEDLLELVEVELLRHHAKATLEAGRVLVEVVAEHRDRTAGLVHQGRENPDGGGLARAVGAEQGEEITFGDVQVDALEGLETVAVGFRQLTDGQGGTH